MMGEKVESEAAQDKDWVPRTGGCHGTPYLFMESRNPHLQYVNPTKIYTVPQSHNMLHGTSQKLLDEILKPGRMIDGQPIMNSGNTDDAAHCTYLKIKHVYSRKL